TRREQSTKERHGRLEVAARPGHSGALRKFHRRRHPVGAEHGGCEQVGRALVLPVLSDFLATYPKVTVELHFDDRRRDLLREGFDFGIRHGRPIDKGYVAQRLCSMSLTLVASPAYLERRGIPHHPSELCEHECIAIRMQDGSPSVWVFELL